MADQPFLERPNTRGLLLEDWDENVAGLQYRDVREYAKANVCCFINHLVQNQVL